mgnify:CR=1 FL=1
MMNPFRIVWELIEFAIQALFLYILAIIIVIGVLVYGIASLENKAEKIIYKDRIIIEQMTVPAEPEPIPPACERIAGCRVLEDGSIEY